MAHLAAVLMAVDAVNGYASQVIPGAAVAHALRYGKHQCCDPCRKRQDQPLQRKGYSIRADENIHTVAIDGDFDACQALVKDAFDGS